MIEASEDFLLLAATLLTALPVKSEPGKSGYALISRDY